MVPVGVELVAPALHRLVVAEAAQAIDQRRARVGGELVFGDQRAGHTQPETAERARLAAPAHRHVEPRGIEPALVFLLHRDDVDEAVGEAPHDGRVVVVDGVAEDRLFADVGDDVGLADAPVVEAAAPVSVGLEDHAQAELLGLLGPQLGVGEAVHRWLADLARDRVAHEAGGDAGAHRAEHLRDRWRPEAGAIRGARQQRAVGAEADAELGVGAVQAGRGAVGGGVEHAVVAVVADRELAFPLRRERRNHFGIGALHVARVGGVGQQRARGRAVADHVVALENVGGAELALLAAGLGPEGQHQVAAAQAGQCARDLAVDDGGGAFGDARGATQLDRIHERLAGFGGQRKGVVDAADHAGAQPRVRDPAREVLVGGLVDAAVECRVVVPSGHCAGGAEHEARGLALDPAGAFSGVRQAEAEGHWRRDAGHGAQRRRQRHAHAGGDVAAGGRRRGVVGLGSAEQALDEQLVLIGQLEGGAADDVGFFRLRVDLGVAHVIEGAALATAQRRRRDRVRVGAAGTRRFREVDAPR